MIVLFKTVFDKMPFSGLLTYLQWGYQDSAFYKHPLPTTHPIPMLIPVSTAG